MNRTHVYHSRLIIFLLLGVALLASAMPAHAATTSVDHTEDGLALGYPDSRKMIRDSRGNLYVAYRKKFKQVSSTFYHIFVAKSTNAGATWTVLNNNRPIE